MNPINSELERILSFINPDNQEILEIGCGRAPHARYLAKNAKRYVAIDNFEEAIKENQQNPENKGVSQLHFEIGSAEELRFDNESFDIVFMSFSFHEIDNPKQGPALMEIHRVLKPNGVLLIIDPAIPSSPYQNCFDKVLEKFRLFNHPFAVANAIWTINKAIETKLFKADAVRPFEVPEPFESIESFLQMLQENCPEIVWNEKNKDILKEEIVPLLKDEDISNGLNDTVVFYKLVKIKLQD